MSKRKGRVTTTIELRTGDVLMNPTVRSDSTVIQVRAIRDGIFVSLANGNTVEIPDATKIRISRPTRTVNTDLPRLVHTTGA